MKKFTFGVLLIVLLARLGAAQDSLIISSIYSEALTDKSAYDNLRFLCKNIGGRIAGSPQSFEAVQWVKKVLEDMFLDKVYLMETKVRKWERGSIEKAIVHCNGSGNIDLSVCALGTSVGTPENGIRGKVIEVKSFDELKSMGSEYVAGKIVFFNRPADQKYYNTNRSYGTSVDQRVNGAIEASKLGAIGVIVRSSTLSLDDFPHTGILRYVDTVAKIPALGISTLDADMLSELLVNDENTEIEMFLSAAEIPEVVSYNVIGEIKGDEYPEKIIVVSGHLDSWDNGEGAHDDGAGIVQSIDVLRIIKTIGYRPRHTIRFVAFMDEEIAQRGGRTYAENVSRNREIHIAAIESDAGALLPLGFSYDADSLSQSKLDNWKNFLLPYGLYLFRKGGGGVDISFLKKLGVPLFGLITDSQRYFDFHHSGNDVFENVHIRELQLGSASLASLVYLIDKYEINGN